MKIYDLWFDYEQDKGNAGKLLELLKTDPAAFKAEFELCDQDAEGGETSLQWLQRELRMKPEEQHDTMYKFVHAWKTMMQKRGRETGAVPPGGYCVHPFIVEVDMDETSAEELFALPVFAAQQRWCLIVEVDNLSAEGVGSGIYQHVEDGLGMLPNNMGAVHWISHGVWVYYANGYQFSRVEVYDYMARHKLLNRMPWPKVVQVVNPELRMTDEPPLLEWEDWTEKPYAHSRGTKCCRVAAMDADVVPAVAKRCHDGYFTAGTRGRAAVVEVPVGWPDEAYMYALAEAVRRWPSTYNFLSFMVQEEEE